MNIQMYGEAEILRKGFAKEFSLEFSAAAGAVLVEVTHPWWTCGWCKCCRWCPCSSYPCNCRYVDEQAPFSPVTLFAWDAPLNSGNLFCSKFADFGCAGLIMSNNMLVRKMAAMTHFLIGLVIGVTIPYPRIMEKASGLPMLESRKAFPLLASAPAITYTVGEVKTNSCPAGSDKITTEQACKDAAQALGKKFNVKGSWVTSPSGCLDESVGLKRGMFFNENAGSAHKDQAPVCSAPPQAAAITGPMSCADLGGIPDRRETPDKPIPACLDPTCEQAGGQPPGDTVGCMNSNPQNGFVAKNSEDNWGFKNCCLGGIKAQGFKCSETRKPPCVCDVSSAECISEGSVKRNKESSAVGISLSL
jgi:hypothetical protein